ncbi:ComF family protein [Candidatus Halobeggiatoa sp. HSG11]|nr:ComF family protein [Candidatus Halobeggiatoa sp. HSG11]
MLNFKSSNFILITKRLLLQNCFLCGSDSNQLLCTACLSDLPYQTSTCYNCAKPLKTGNLCKQCQQNLPPYTRVQAVFSYVYPVNKLISVAKFKENLPVLNLLGSLMVKYLQIETRPDILIPIPLHPKRLRQRGYNQSLELTKYISKHTGIPLSYNSCQRIKNTRPQVGLSTSKRATNIQDAFKVNKIKKNWQYIILIDDVMTTGSTVEALTKEFLKAGIKRVDVWCCARR